MWQVQKKKKSILKKAEVSKADFRCDSKVTCLASKRLKKIFLKTLFNIKIQDKIYCQQLLLETAQLSQLGLPIPLSGTSRIFHAHVPSSVYPTLTVAGQTQTVGVEWRGWGASMRRLYALYAEGDTKVGVSEGKKQSGNGSN